MNAPFALRASVALEPELFTYRVVIDQATVDDRFWRIVAVAMRPPSAGIPGTTFRPPRVVGGLAVPAAADGAARRFARERSPPNTRHGSPSN